MTIRLLMLSSLVLALSAKADDLWVTYEGGDGPGKGKSIVFVSGDEEYRSEEGLPMLARLLAKHHGFKCTVVFAIDEKTGQINPDNGGNIPGLEALDSADLMVIQTRFRHLPDDQMKHFDDFLKAGKPVIGLRTATHAFSGIKGTYAKFNNGYKGEGNNDPWADGFGRLVLGEKWISHHGDHMHEATRGVFAEGAKGSPLLNGIADGEIWGPTDVYGVRLPLPDTCKVLVLGQVCDGFHLPKPYNALNNLTPEQIARFKDNDKKYSAQIKAIKGRQPKSLKDSEEARKLIPEEIKAAETQHKADMLALLTDAQRNEIAGASTNGETKDDPNYGMKPTDEPLPSTDKKNSPMMPIAWTKTYQVPDGKPGRSFTTTMGSSTDLSNEALRRLLVNAAYDLVGLKVPDKADVSIVGEYKPNAYKGGGYTKGVKPSELK
jgi:hypothetical protein